MVLQRDKAVMKGCSAGLQPPTREFVKTIRSRSSMARKPAAQCGVKSAAVFADPGFQRAARTQVHFQNLAFGRRGIHHCSKLARSVHAFQTAGRGRLDYPARP